MADTFRAIAKNLEDQLPFFQQMEEVFSKQERIAIGISWGADSMLLTLSAYHIWKKLNKADEDFFLIHCNHRIRAESEKEKKQLAELFEGFPFFVFSREEEVRKSEEALRTWRYTCFDRLCQEKDISLLLLGHNLSDRIESSIMHMLRGCGIKGFLSIKELDNHHLMSNAQVFRPLLALSKQAISKLCLKRRLPFFEDLSNQDSSISLRNKVRNEFLFPLSKLAHNQRIEENSFFASWHRVYQQLENLENKEDPFLIPINPCPYWKSSHAYKWTIPGKEQLEKEQLAALLIQLSIPIREQELDELWQWIQQEGEGFRQIGGWFFCAAHDQIFLIQAKEIFWDKELHKEKIIKATGMQTFGNYHIDIDEELIGATLRFPREEDHFHGKKIKKWMINQKIPFFRRNYLPLAEKEGKIIVVWKPWQLFF